MAVGGVSATERPVATNSGCGDEFRLWLAAWPANGAGRGGGSAGWARVSAGLLAGEEESSD